MICVCFSPAGACCPLGVKLYRLGPNGIRIYWQASRGSANYSTDLYGSKGIFTCAPSAGLSFCDVTEIPCGDVYTVMVSPVSETGLKLTFCPKKIYSGRAIEPSCHLYVIGNFRFWFSVKVSELIFTPLSVITYKVLGPYHLISLQNFFRNI